MNKERALLKAERDKYKERLGGLKTYLHGLERRREEHGTDNEHIEAELFETRHNIEFYKGQIKEINERLKELHKSSKKPSY